MKRILAFLLLATLAEAGVKTNYFNASPMVVSNLLVQSGITLGGSNITSWSGLGGGGGTSDHAGLSNILWTASGHTGTPARIAGFLEGGSPGYIVVGTGLQLDGSDNLVVTSSPYATFAASSLYATNSGTATYAGTAGSGWPTNWAWSSITGAPSFVTNGQSAVRLNDSLYLGTTTGQGYPWIGLHDGGSSKTNFIYSTDAGFLFTSSNGKDVLTVQTDALTIDGAMRFVGNGSGLTNLPSDASKMATNGITIVQTTNSAGVASVSGGQISIGTNLPPSGTVGAITNVNITVNTSGGLTVDGGTSKVLTNGGSYTLAQASSTPWTNSIMLRTGSFRNATTNDFLGGIITGNETLDTASGASVALFNTVANAATNIYNGSAWFVFPWPAGNDMTTLQLGFRKSGTTTTNFPLTLGYSNRLTGATASMVLTGQAPVADTTYWTNMSIASSICTQAVQGSEWILRWDASFGATNGATQPAYMGISVQGTLFK